MKYRKLIGGEDEKGSIGDRKTVNLL